MILRIYLNTAQSPSNPAHFSFLLIEPLLLHPTALLSTMSPFITNYPMTTPSTPVKKRVDRNRTYEARMATPQEIPSPDDESPILSTKKGKLASLRVG